MKIHQVEILEYFKFLRYQRFNQLVELKVVVLQEKLGTQFMVFLVIKEIKLVLILFLDFIKA